MTKTRKMIMMTTRMNSTTSRDDDQEMVNSMIIFIQLMNESGSIRDNVHELFTLCTGRCITSRS